MTAARLLRCSCPYRHLGAWSKGCPLHDPDAHLPADRLSDRALVARVRRWFERVAWRRG